MSDNNRTASMSGLLVGNEPIAKVSDVEYSKVQSYFEMLDAVSRLTYQSIYVMDYCKMNFLYVSDNPIFLCGYSREEVMAKGFDFLLEQCKPEEVRALIEINRASLEFIHKVPVSERTRYSVSYNYHIRSSRMGKWRLVHHKRTPLALSDAGELWLILCSIDWAPDDSNLRATVTSEISSKVWYYDLNKMSWNESLQVTLTELEKAVLVLSNRGFTMNEIADAIFKSVDSVKGYRKSLFVKLGVSNITEAIACAKVRKLV